MPCCPILYCILLSDTNTYALLSAHPLLLILIFFYFIFFILFFSFLFLFFSSFNSTRDWSRKPKNYKKNNASMPAKLEKTEENMSHTDTVSDGISVLPSKVCLSKKTYFVFCITYDGEGLLCSAFLDISFCQVLFLILMTDLLFLFISYFFPPSYFISLPSPSSILPPSYPYTLSIPRPPLPSLLIHILHSTHLFLPPSLLLPPPSSPSLLPSLPSFLPPFLFLSPQCLSSRTSRINQCPCLLALWGGREGPVLCLNWLRRRHRWMMTEQVRW